MAESTSTWMGSGIGSWFNAAKEKIRNSEVLESVKKDLEEFGSAVKKEASNVVSSTGAVLEKTLSLDSPDSTANTVKKSFSTFLGQMNTVLNPSPEDDDQETIMVIEGSETVKLNKVQEALFKLQNDEKTFTTDPEEILQKQYQCWLEIIDDQLSPERLERHLNASFTLSKQFLKLVPDQVNEEIFWKRYLFKKALLEDNIAREDAFKKREEKEKCFDEESVKWEQEDFAQNIDIPEDIQIKLLEQYENETKQRKQSKPTGAPAQKTSSKSSSGSSTPTVNKTDSAISLDNVVSSSSSSIDDEWEKIDK